MRELVESLQNMVLSRQDSIKELVKQAFGTNELGKANKSHWTLYREINPHDRDAKLGVIDAVKLMLATGDHRPLELIADMLGYSLTRNEASPDKPTLHAEMLQDYPAIVAMHSSIDEEAPVAVVVDLAQRARHELDQTVASYKISRRASGHYDGAVIAPHTVGRQ